jgi:hypothetical protein
MYYQTKQSTPCAFITKDKQRLKQFGQNVYLKNGEEFEIELFNPTKTTVLSKIKINGTYISGGGIVLKPGQRVFLERYLGESRKFKFDTYEVETNSREVMEAIQNNGDVIIEFYNESPPKTPNWSTDWVFNDWLGNSSNKKYYNPTFTTNGLGMTNTNFTSEVSCKYSSNVKSIETGRIEMGGKSDQEFSYVNKNFDSWVCSTSEWKILPDSQKPVIIKDLIEKCPKCSTKFKKSSWKFCPECGYQRTRTKTEIYYTTETRVSIDGEHYLMSSYNDTLDNFLKRHENKLIYIKSDSLTENFLRAIVID